MREGRLSEKIWTWKNCPVDEDKVLRWEFTTHYELPFTAELRLCEKSVARYARRMARLRVRRA